MISQSTALNYLAAGLSVLPARKKEKCPASLMLMDDLLLGVVGELIRAGDFT